MAQITHDHTHVGWLRRQGKLNEREARFHPRRNVLSQALGAGHQFLEPQTVSLRVEPGDRFLFCTDGVTDGLWDHRLQDLVCAPTAAEAAFPPARRSGRHCSLCNLAQMAGWSHVSVAIHGGWI